MVSTYSPLKIQLMATGENDTTWGNITNVNLGTALEEAIANTADVTFASADVTLTLVNLNTTQSARRARLSLIGTTGGVTRNLIVPAIEKAYIVSNACADSITIKNATGTGITVPAGKTLWVYNNATNVVSAVNYLTDLTLGTVLPVTSGGTGGSTAALARAALSAAALGANGDITSLTGLTTPLSVAQGGTGLATLTANAVLTGNGTSTPGSVAPGTVGNVLTSNGTIWTSTALPSGAVTSVSGGTTGLTPSTPTGGAVVLAGTLAATNGGTGQATLSAARGAFGSGVSSRKTAAYTAVAGDVLACDTISVAAFTVTLPASPVAGDAPIKIYDAGTTTSVNGFATNNLTIARNGNTICTLAEDVIVSTKGVTIICEYVNGTWRLYNG